MFADERDEYADSVQSALTEQQAVAPWLWRYEVVNALLVAERRGRIGRDVVDAQLAALVRLPILTDDTAPSSERIADIGRRHQRTAYDALYLEIALRRNLPMATLDGGLRQACGEAGIELFAP